MIDLRHIRNILVPYWNNTQNRKWVRRSQSLTITKPIHIFYHIFCGPNRWKEIVGEQIEMMKQSGLFEATTTMHFTLIGSAQDLEWFYDQFLEEERKKLELIYHSQDGSCFEFPTLEEFERLSRAGLDFIALYLHSKGTSYNYDPKNMSKEHYRNRLRNADSWRDLMNYFNIRWWKVAVTLLQNGYDTYGALLMEPHSHINQRHYSGNFWWSTSANIRHCAPLTRENRWNAEIWSVNDRTKAYCAYYSWVLLYGTCLPESTYNKSTFNHLNIKHLFYHYKTGRKFLLY